jgi:hypothetical protein
VPTAVNECSPGTRDHTCQALTCRTMFQLSRSRSLSIAEFARVFVNAAQQNPLCVRTAMVEVPEKKPLWYRGVNGAVHHGGKPTSDVRNGSAFAIRRIFPLARIVRAAWYRASASQGLRTKNVSSKK